MSQHATTAGVCPPHDLSAGSVTPDWDLLAAWHDLECGRYGADLPLWRVLADEHPGPILDVGAGTGRVSLALAADGRDVVALDLDPELLAALRQRAGQRPIETVCADARDFSLQRRFTLILVPMQTLQLLGGAAGHSAFFAAARAHLEAGGIVATAITPPENFEPFRWRDGDRSPLPDIGEAAGRVLVSQPTAVSRAGDQFILTRRRELVTAEGTLQRSEHRITLDAVTVAEVADSARRAGLQVRDVRSIPATHEHIGSEVVICGV